MTKEQYEALVLFAFFATAVMIVFTPLALLAEWLERDERNRKKPK